MKLGHKIKLFIETQEINQVDFANLCGWEESQGRVNHYIHARRRPSLKDIEIMAKVMKTTPEWLSYDRGEAPAWFPLKADDANNKKIQPGKIPHFTDNDLKSEIPKTENYMLFDNPNLFVSPVQGHSMVDFNNPTNSFYPDKDLLLLEKDKTPANGDFILVRRSDTEVVFRVYYEDSGKKLLIPLDRKNFEILQLTEKDKILGVLVYKINKPF